ncbi:hypothetical protein ASF55_15635 [Methylobacterium sp. Leaf119]|nr:hypothetical protein ASF55_15635 [Methylobacterium sp. Leaf119]
MPRFASETIMPPITTEDALYKFLLALACSTGEEELLPVAYVTRVEQLVSAVGILAPASVPDSFRRPAEAMLYCITSVTLDNERAAPGPRRAVHPNLEKLFRILVAGYMANVTIRAANDALLTLLALPQARLVETVKHQGWWLLRTSPLGQQELGVSIAVARNRPLD